MLFRSLDFILEMSDAKEPIKEWANQQWSEKTQPVVKHFLEQAGQFISSSFNQPTALPAQPPVPKPEPPIDTNPTSTPTPEDLRK